VAVAVFVNDLTEFRRADEQLRREKQRHIFIMESLPGFVFLLAPDMSIRYANHTFRRLFGSPRKGRCHELMLGKPTPCAVCPPREAIARRHMQAWQWERPDGRTYAIYAHPMSDVDGSPLVLALGIDITDRTLAERSLERSQRLQKAILDNIPDIAWLADRDGRFIAVNKAFEAIVEQLGRIPGSAAPAGNWRQDVAREVRLDGLEIARTGNKAVCEDRVGEGNGQQRWFEAITTPLLSTDGELLLSVGIARDVTERKLVQEDLEERVSLRTRELEQANLLLERNAQKLERAKRKAVEATKAKSTFLANMSHEIRAPMNAILGMTELALRAGVEPQVRRYLDLVKSGSNSLLGVINDILDFSKIEAGKLDLEDIDFDLHELLTLLTGLLGHEAERKGLSLALDIETDVPRLLRGDPTRLRQILSNLINNAVKFTERGGIVVSISRTSNRAHRAAHDCTLIFSVKDSGIGIPAERQRDIFKSFSQADGSITRRYGGTGLGLSICKQLVRLMGGSITLESEEGRGSTFLFTANFKPGDERNLQACKEAAAPMPLAPLKILLAEDSSLNQELLTSLLRPMGHALVLANNGKEAVAALRREHGRTDARDGRPGGHAGDPGTRLRRAGS